MARQDDHKRLPILKEGPAFPDPGALGTFPLALVVGGEDGLLQVGDLARETGKTVRALHLYEELGLLKPHARSKGRFRLYGPDALVRVRWITKLNEAGLSLAEIADLLRGFQASDSASFAMQRIRGVFEARLAETRAQLDKLRTLEDELVSSLRYLDECDVCDPARHTGQCTRCDLHANEAPALVLGVQNG